MNHFKLDLNVEDKNLFLSETDMDFLLSHSCTERAEDLIFHLDFVSLQQKAALSEWP